jgi:ComF family protein
MHLLDKLTGMLAPHICLGCGWEGALLCQECEGLFPPPLENTVVTGIEAVRAATIYEGIAKDLVWKLKFGGAREAADIMAGVMVPLTPQDPEAIIVPVPTAARRVRQRGFDQAKLLAKLLSRRSGMRYVDCLRRHGQTHQVGASREQRLRQLAEAFSLKKKPQESIILVDDVLTTGATLETAGAVVRAGGATHVEAAVFGQVE